ncbi:MAG: DNA polymerase I [Planctomycetota bacterium]
MSEKFFLIDGHAHCYKSFYAIRHLSAPDGRPTNAAFGFTRMILNLLKKEEPDYIAAAFDTPDLTFRHEEYEDYKAQRQAMPDELQPQIPIIRDILDAANVPLVAVPGYEADDVIGTLAKQASREGIDVYIATGDKDALQLLDGRVRLYDTQTGKAYTAEDLAEEKGIRPDQVPDMMALSGDTSDNVPGIHGVGPKTALKLIREYETLENVLEHADEVSGKVLSRRLAEGAEDARTSRRLVTLDLDVPLDLTVPDCQRREPDKEKLFGIFTELGFKKFIAELGGVEEVADTAPVAGERGEVRYHTVDTGDALGELAEALAGQDRISVDLETTSRRPMAASIVGFSFAWEGREAWYVPVAGPLGSRTLSLDAALEALRPVLESERPAKIGQNLKYDCVVLRNAGVRLRGISFDTMVAAYLLDPDRRRYNLDDLTLGYLGFRKIPTVDLVGKGRDEITMDRVDVEKVAEYACEDADTVVRLFDVLSPKLEETGLAELARELEFPLVEVLAEMEYTGITLDSRTLSEISEELAARLEAIAGRIYEEAGEEFNIDSPKQLSAVLFDKLGMPPKRRTKTGYSTAAGVLEELAVDYPIAAMVSRYRALKKLKSTYTDVLPRMVNPSTGRVHTSFNQTMTATGRLSSSEPNLQNIPVRTDEGRAIRRAFVASGPDRRLLAADYSQIELRILAHFSGDPALCDAFRSDLDIHAFVAAEVSGVGIDDVDRSMRRRAKAVNFGIIYGLTPYGLSKGIGVSVAAAKDFIDAYFARYSQVRAFIDQTIEVAREQGFVTTMFGRRRYLRNIRSENDTERRYAERMAVNAVIQGTAADMAKIAMNRIHRRIENEGRPSSMLLQIHDELVFEVPVDELDGEREMIRDEMVGAGELDVAIKVNIGVGRNWLEVK